MFLLRYMVISVYIALSLYILYIHFFLWREKEKNIPKRHVKKYIQYISPNRFCPETEPGQTGTTNLQ